MPKNAQYLNFLAKFGIGGAHPGGLFITEQLLNKVTISKETKLLDVGCGTGQTSAFIKNKYNCHVSSIEYNEEMVQKAKQRFQNQQLDIDIIPGNAEELPYQDQSFDIILSESVVAFTQIDKTLSEIYRVLKPGGKLLINEMAKDYPFSKQEEADIKHFYGVTEVLSEEDWKQKLTNVGFKSIYMEKQLNHDELGANASQNMPEFSFSPDLNPEMFNIMEKHFAISSEYKDKLTYRAFICEK